MQCCKHTYMQLPKRAVINKNRVQEGLYVQYLHKIKFLSAHKSSWLTKESAGYKLKEL